MTRSMGLDAEAHAGILDPQRWLVSNTDGDLVTRENHTWHDTYGLRLTLDFVLGRVRDVWPNSSPSPGPSCNIRLSRKPSTSDTPGRVGLILPKMNGVHSNGSSAGNSNSEKVNGHHSSSSKDTRPLADHPKGEWKGKRTDIDHDDPYHGTQGGLISQYLKMKKVAKRPLPTVHGDGSYPKDQTRPTAMANIKALQKRGAWRLVQLTLCISFAR